MKILAHVGDQLLVRRMIGRFDTDNSLFQRRQLLVQVSDEMKLGHRRPDDQNLLGAFQRVRDVVEESVFVVRVVVRPGLLSFWMAVDVVVR